MGGSIKEGSTVIPGNMQTFMLAWCTAPGRSAASYLSSIDNTRLMCMHVTACVSDTTWGYR